MICSRCGYTPWENQRSWKLILRTPAISQNELGGNNRGWHGYRYRKYKGKFENALAVATRKCPVPVAAVFRRLVVTRFYGLGCRPFDEGNLVGGAKPLVDVLVARGILVDDSPKFVKIWYDQQRCPRGSAYVKVLVEEQVLDAPVA